MKKAKIMLTAITVLAIGGGALAFKAKTFGAYNVYTSSFIGPDPTCVLATFAVRSLGDPAYNATVSTIEGIVTNQTPDVAADCQNVTTWKVN